MSTNKSAQNKTAGAYANTISRAAREPLIQFLGAGLLLFLANSLLNETEQQNTGDAITITQGRIQQITESFRSQAGRMPTESELQVLVDDFIDEEIYYREAIAMGLDADDTIIRRRMRQKLEFLVEDADASEPPSDEQLATWLKAHEDTYRIPARISFRHVLASKDKHGVNAEAEAMAFLAKLNAGVAPESLGDMSMLPSALPLTTQKGVTAQFGEKFAVTLFSYDDEGWNGPISSPFGVHAVQIISHDPARPPSLDEIREKLKSDWIEARRTERQNAYRDRLRARYDVNIEWPETSTGKPSAHNDISAD